MMQRQLFCCAIEVWVHLESGFGLLVFLRCLNFSAPSLGLLCMGSDICNVPRGKTRVLQGFKIWYWSRASTEKSTGFHEGVFSSFIFMQLYVEFDFVSVFFWLSIFQGHSRTRSLCCPDLLEQLPALQQLLFRLTNCQVVWFIWSHHRSLRFLRRENLEILH